MVDVPLIYIGIFNNAIDPSLFLNRSCFTYNKDLKEYVNKQSLGLQVARVHLRGDLSLKNNNNYGKKCGFGDIINMCLDLNLKKLSYIINGKDYGVAFNIDDIDTQWRACIHCWGNSTVKDKREIKLLQYKQK